MSSAPHRTRSPAHPLPGGYALGPEIGRGATASVHRAQDGEGRPVAAKRLHDERHAARQTIEARLLHALDHPRIVKVHDLVEDASGRYLIMDWIDGRDLATVLLREGPQPPDRVIGWMLEAADGLAYVHAQQTVHRDIKPHNLMLSPDRGIVVVDFGIARSFTRQGTEQVGTPGFMAPESQTGGPITARTDVFGLAACAWALIAGAPPRPGAGDLLPGATPELTAALHAALAVDPRDRTPSMQAFAEALGGRVEGAGRSLGVTVDLDPERRPLLQSVVRTASGMLGAAATSLALVRPGGALLYYAAWGAGGEEIIGRELDPGRGIAGRAVRENRPQLVHDVRADPDWDAPFAGDTGYTPNSMLVVPTGPGPSGVLSLLDRRDGLPFDLEDLQRARLFADLALETLSQPVS